MGPETPATPVDTQTAFQGTQQGGVTLEDLRDSLAALVGQSNDPVFGSVVQNIYTPGLSNVSAVETTFTADRFTLEVSRQDGSSFKLGHQPGSDGAHAAVWSQ